MQAGQQQRVPFEIEDGAIGSTHPVLITSSDSISFVRVDHHYAAYDNARHNVKTISKIEKQNDYRFYLVLFLSSTYFFVEVFVGVYYKYLALVADAMHMLSDVIAMLVGLYAMRLSRKHASEHNTFGWYVFIMLALVSVISSFGRTRCEVVGGLINSTFMMAVCLTITVDAVSTIIKNDFEEQKRLGDTIDVVLWTSAGGLVLNFIGMLILGSGRHSSTDDSGEKSTTSALKNKNMQGVLLHVAADGLGSVAVLSSVLFIKFSSFSWKYLADPVLSILIVMLLAIATIPLMREATAILLQQTPRDIDVKKIVHRLLSWGDVMGIHNFHIWTLANDRIIASMHVTLTKDADIAHVLNRFSIVLKEFGVSSATIHPEVYKAGRADDCKQAV